MSGTRGLVERFIASLEARDWPAWAGLLHPDVIYEIPQSRERIRGRDRYLRFNQEYAGDWHLRPKVVIADKRNGESAPGRAVTGHYTVRAPRARVNSCKVVLNRRRMSSDAIRS